MTDSSANTARVSLRTLLWLAIGILVTLFAVSTAFSVYGRLAVRASVDDLSEQLRPAQRAVAELTTSYVNQETGQRGYTLTGDPQFLEPYDAGRRDAAALHTRLDTLLAEDAAAQAALQRTAEAAEMWRTRAAEPQISARRDNASEPDRIQSTTATGKELFDDLRARLAELSARTDVLVTEQVERVHSAQALANIATVVAFVLAVVTAVTAVYLTRRLLTRPIDRLLADIGAVAGGDYGREIDTDGPREVAIIAGAVDTMRTSLLAKNEQLMAAERARARDDEQGRMAADLHDMTLQRVFGLGLALTSLGVRHPRLSADLDPLIDETDSIVRGLRAVIFDLTGSTGAARSGEAGSLSAAVSEIVDNSAAALGFTPDVCVEGPVDRYSGSEAGPELQAALREALSNVARHAQASVCSVRVTAAADGLVLTVSDNGTGIAAGAAHGDGLTNIRRRAERLGGHAVFRDLGPGTAVEWAIPAPEASPQVTDRPLPGDV
ncbi:MULTISPECIES: sensor histidine kinase [Rhodococcus]|uniref:sensor histidine kinase n=1 Tax=Rhodococcus TaxID=1827 RepID=UPI002285D59E|nr:CHASE3 domain-containing protein [Rhodococcus sp. JS3073]WAM14701.1 CHASE3 domain-containing protein [Rhodococcus sp. JS3073]